MIHVINDSNNPYFNLALEEYFLKDKYLNEDILILWQNDPVIVFGKNQNIYAEVNFPYVESRNIKLVRRMSGGGAVYHDHGNLNFTVIKRNARIQQNNFQFFVQPVVRCLQAYGVDASFSGRNDLMIGDRKFSGNAQYAYRNSLLHHGTLLFSSDLEVLTQALKVNNEKLKSKGVASIKGRVTNISEHLPGSVTLDLFKVSLIQRIAEESEQFQIYYLTAADEEAVNRRMKERYLTDEWNYELRGDNGEQPAFRFAGGTLTIDIEIIEGMIQRFRLWGDYFENRPVSQLEELFIKLPFQRNALEQKLSTICVSDYIHKLDNKTLVDFIFHEK